MKSLHSLLALAVSSILFAGCGNDSAPQSPATPPPAPAAKAATDSSNPLVNAKRHADKTVDAAALNQAVQLFNVQEGRLPQTLAELVPNYIAKLPPAPIGYKINYDAAKGEVKVVKE